MVGILPSGMNTAKEFLTTLLSSQSNRDSKKKLVELLQGLRASESPTVSRVESKETKAVWNGPYTQFLNELLEEIDSVKDNKLAMFNYRMIPIPSYRVKVGCLNRLLSSIIEDEISEFQGNVSDYNLPVRKRRALSVILSQLPAAKSIRTLEREAENARKKLTMKDMLQRTPKLETPSYNVITSDTNSNIEIRKYLPFTVVTTVMDDTSPDGFNLLAKYIFGGNKIKETMKMTTPVITSKLSNAATDIDSKRSSSKKVMSFIMPVKYWDSNVDHAPSPLPLDNIKVESNGGTFLTKSPTLAVIYFGGYATEKQIAKKTSELISYVNNSKEWALAVDNGHEAAEPFLMQYNDPFQPGWKRRNEIAFNVIERQQ